MNNIHHAEHAGCSFNIVHEDDQADNFMIDAIRCGIVWPTSEAPGYFCTIGRRPDYNDQHKKPLVLLTEGEYELPKDLIQAISGQVTVMKCKAFYTDVNERTVVFIDDLETYLSRFHPGSTTIDAPYLRDWIMGVLSVQQWMHDKSLEFIENSLMLKQIKGMVHPDDKDEANRGRLYAVDALRTVLGSFELQPCPPVVIKKSGYVYT